MYWSRLFYLSLSFLLAVLSPPASAQNLVPLPTQPDDQPWPTRGWATSISGHDALDDLMTPVFSSDVTDGLGETRALVVIQSGELVYERYRDGYRSRTRHVSWSMAKSITHALVGRAVQTGLIASIDDPMPAAFADDDPRSEISWRHWLQMRDGLNYAEYGVEGLDNDVIQMMYGPGKYNVVTYARENFDLKATPGSEWNYSTAGYHLIARAIQSLLPDTCLDPEDNPRTCKADPAVMSAWLDEVLFIPLGLDAVEEYDAAGTFLGGSLIYMSARDFARFGYLYLRDGMWEGERLLPEGWVDFARTNPPQTTSNEYGAGFWLTPERSTNPGLVFKPPYDAFHAGGHEGQTIWIVPSRDMVIVRLGLMPNGNQTWSGLFALNQDIVATLSGE